MFSIFKNSTNAAHMFKNLVSLDFVLPASDVLFPLRHFQKNFFFKISNSSSIVIFTSTRTDVPPSSQLRTTQTSIEVAFHFQKARINGSFLSSYTLRLVHSFCSNRTPFHGVPSLSKELSKSWRNIGCLRMHAFSLLFLWCMHR